MRRTDENDKASQRENRRVWINGERVDDVTAHPAIAPIVNVRARIYDMAHEGPYRDLMSYRSNGTNEASCIGHKLSRTEQDWRDKRAAVDAVMNDFGGVVTRVGDETVGEMWSLHDGRDVLDEVDPRFGENILLHAVRETDAGIVVRGAKYETAAAYSNQAFVKPTIANWGDAEFSDYTLGFIVPMNAPGLKHICRTGCRREVRP